MTTNRAVLLDIGGTLFTYDQVRNADETNARLATALGLEAEAIAQASKAGMARAAGEYFTRPFYLHREFFAAARRYSAEHLSLEGEHLQLYLDPSPLRDKDAPASNLANVRPSPGVVETLEELKRRDIHIGAVSNSDTDMFEAMMGALGVEEYFDHMLCSEMAGSCKPDEKIFLQALEAAGCEPHEALFVGDTPDHDIAGATRVGMRGLLIVEHTGIGFERGAAAEGQPTITEFKELLDHL